MLERHLPLLRRLTSIAFVAACVLAVVRALWPDPITEAHMPWDKAVHAVAFYVLTVMGCIAYPKAPLYRLALSMAVLGGLIELLQALPIIHRDAAWQDWAADWAGIVLALTPMAVPRLRAWFSA